MDRFECHSCQAKGTLQYNNLKCTNCGSEFIEILEDEPEQQQQQQQQQQIPQFGFHSFFRNFDQIPHFDFPPIQHSFNFQINNTDGLGYVPFY